MGERFAVRLAGFGAGSGFAATSTRPGTAFGCTRLGSSGVPIAGAGFAASTRGGLAGEPGFTRAGAGLLVRTSTTGDEGAGAGARQCRMPRTTAAAAPLRAAQAHGPAKNARCAGRVSGAGSAA